MTVSEGYVKKAKEYIELLPGQKINLQLSSYNNETIIALANAMKIGIEFAEQKGQNENRGNNNGTIK